MTRGQRMAHARIWTLLAIVVAGAALYALARRSAWPTQEPPPALASTGDAS